MKIYVASSWRNHYQPVAVNRLRRAGHEVYDFRTDSGFRWSEIDPDWPMWSPGKYRDRLSHPIAEAAFKSDMDALRWCDCVVGVQPFGRSASFELGWAAGSGKRTILLLSDGEPELMVKMFDKICLTLDGVLSTIEEWASA